MRPLYTAIRFISYPSIPHKAAEYHPFGGSTVMDIIILRLHLCLPNGHLQFFGCQIQHILLCHDTAAGQADTISARSDAASRHSRSSIPALSAKQNIPRYDLLSPHIGHNPPCSQKRRKRNFPLPFHQIKRQQTKCSRCR